MKIIVGILFLLYLFSISLFSQELVYSEVYDSSEFENRNNCTDIRYGCNGYLHFVYPVIFIHGWGGNSNSWEEQFSNLIDGGWSYGGSLEFCLNANNNHDYSLLNVDVKDFVRNVTAGDFYTINFDVHPDGTGYYDGRSDNSRLSNQAAVVKQGFALAKAIRYVRNLTGRDKVILFGHSMGGLAAREYLQNPNYWSSEGHHHVAKLITTGTPHGGSNTSFTELGGFLGYLGYGLDINSEAVRDLRSEYEYGSGAKGVYLFGGREAAGTINNGGLTNFYNIDVNCNGRIGDYVTGLNQKDIQDIDYTCIVGILGLLDNQSDGIVTTYKADLKNYYDVNRELFVVYPENDWLMHTALPSKIKFNRLALDEPDYFEYAYMIKPNVLYNGYIQEQGDGTNVKKDYDDYYFSLSEDGIITIDIGNNVHNDLEVWLYDTNQRVWKYKIPQERTTTTNLELEKGEYLVEIFANPTQDSWQYPYWFRVNFTPTDTDMCSSIPQPNAKWSATHIAYKVFFKNESINATRYLWDFGDGSTSTEENPIHDYLKSGIYTVKLTAWSQCDDYAVFQGSFLLDQVTANIEIASENNFLVYPNPVTDILFFDKQIKFDSYIIHDIHGKQVLTGTFVNAVDVKELRPGSYSLTLQTKTNYVSIIFIKL